MPLAPVVMLPQVHLSGVQPPASAKPIPGVPLASQASYGVTLPPQSLSALSALDERASLLFEKQVCSQLSFSLNACVLIRLYSPCELQVWKLSEFQTVPEAFEAFSKISAVPSELRRWHGSKREARASSTAFSRFKNGLAAEVNTRMAALGSTMADVVGALEMERERIPATRTISSLQSYAAGTAVIASCLANISTAAEHAFNFLPKICFDNS